MDSSGTLAVLAAAGGLTEGRCQYRRQRQHMSTPTPTRQQLFINGAYVDGTGPQTYDVMSPVTGALVGSVPIPSEADLDAAVKAANNAQPAWAALNVWKRAEICHRIGDELSKRVPDLARLQTLEQGKPLAESVADVEEAVQLFHLHAEDAVRLHGEVLPSSDSRKRMFTFHRAVGTWAIITPWNFPVLMLAEFVAPGLATGNAHVVKPPANTPLTVLKAMEAFAAAGLPEAWSTSSRAKAPSATHWCGTPGSTRLASSAPRP